MKKILIYILILFICVSCNYTNNKINNVNYGIVDSIITERQHDPVIHIYTNIYKIKISVNDTVIYLPSNKKINIGDTIIVQLYNN